MRDCEIASLSDWKPLSLGCPCFVFVPFRNSKSKSTLCIFFRDELLGNVAAWDRFPLPEHFVIVSCPDQAERSAVVNE